MTGALAAGALWFGFNYLVLAPRAIEQAHATVVMPQCMQAVDRHQQRQRAAVPKLGDLLAGLPSMNELQSKIMELATPRFLSQPEKVDRCACAARRAGQALRFDYAIHTASFRLIAPGAVASIADDAIDTVLAGTCGVLPSFQRER